MKFTWTTLQVLDMQASLDFYQNIIGLPLKRRFSPDGILDLAFLGNENESEIELIYSPSNKSINTQGISIGFMGNKKLEEVIEIINLRGYKITSEIISPNPNMRFIHVNDPSGYDIQLIE